MSDTTDAPGTAQFEHFDQTWTVPTQRHLSHLVKMRDGMNNRYGDPDVVSAEVMLGDEQFTKLLEIDPTEDELADFVGKIAKALGVGGSDDGDAAGN